MAKNTPIELSFRNVQLLRREELGHGSFGYVCKAQCDQLICAAKVIYRVLRQAVAPDPGREHRLSHRRFESEIEFPKHVHHPNIVQYLGTYEDPDSGDLVLLMELMDESLTYFLESSPEVVPYHTQVNLSYDIAQALAFLHANRIIHRDLSSNNVLLLAGTRAKVTDFGMSKFTERNVSITLSPGTTVYMSPEALNQLPVYTEKLDNFSFGVLLVQIVTRKFPEPTNRFETVRIPNPRDQRLTVNALVLIPEVERRHGHINLIEQAHSLLPLALDCLKDEDQERPSSQELCGRLNTLKRSDRFKESSQQDPAHTIREKLQAQSQQHQVETRGKNEQIQAKDQQIEAKTLEINQLSVQLEQATSEIQAQAGELASRERKLRDFSEQLVACEQNTTTLQKELLQRDKLISELRATPISRPIDMRWESLPNAPVEIIDSTPQGLETQSLPVYRAC